LKNAGGVTLEIYFGPALAIVARVESESAVSLDCSLAKHVARQRTDLFSKYRNISPSKNGWIEKIKSLQQPEIPQKPESILAKLHPALSPPYHCVGAIGGNANHCQELRHPCHHTAIVIDHPSIKKMPNGVF